MKENKHSNQIFDSNREVPSNVFYDVFVFGHKFKHIGLSKSFNQIETEYGRISIDDKNQLLFNGQAWSGDFLHNCVAYSLGELNPTYTNIPRNEFIISNLSSSAIRFATKAFIRFKPVSKEFHLLTLFSNGSYIYFNGEKVDTFDGLFRIGDRLVIDGVLIEKRPEQFKMIGLLQKFQLDSKLFIEETLIEEYPLDFPDYRRSPRIFLRPSEDRIRLNSPKNRKEKKRGEILRTIVPPLGMLVMTGAVTIISRRNPVMLLSMGGASLLTAAFSVSSYWTSKKETEKENKQQEENYQNYLVEKESELAKLAEKQKEALEYNYPSVSDLVSLIRSYRSRIYEKMPSHEDFLNVRLGIGDVKSSFNVDFSEREQTDEWEQFVKKEIVEKYKHISQGPIIISLRDQTLGLAGSLVYLNTAIQTILFQIAAMHSYHDVQFVSLLSDEDYKKSWDYWRWLPHFQLDNLNLRGLIHNEQTRDVVLNSFYQIIVKRRQMVRENASKSAKLNFSPHYVLTILDDSYLLGHGLNEFLAEDMTQYGVTVIWGKENLSMLPETATAVIEYQNNETGTLVNDNREYVNQLFVPNKWDKGINDAIHKLANLNHVEVEKNSIPEAISFLELYQVKTVNDLGISNRWSVADTSKTLAVPLGLRGKNDVVYLNLHERAHGPHGLVAGTTGSGKSEILQSYILSLAVNFAPEDVGFLPIDFKGGGMANLFAKLPHLMGAITNLDGAASARALKSIRAELQKRQREFGRFGVNHINAYTKLYKEGKRLAGSQDGKEYPTKPIPHLFLISDEFAELKQNEPEFMAELVSTARIGRSLGVHLILATQKPSGVVDDQIWSNSRFKLALKVADESDSKEIIKTPDAASIIQPGRAYLQVGNNEIYELFQSAWSGANYQPNSSNEKKVDERIWLINDLGQAELLSSDLSAGEDYQDVSEDEQTELTAVIDEIADLAEANDAILPDKPWLPPLESEIVTPSIDYKTSWKEARQLSIPFALLDLPEKQEQRVFDFDLEEYSHFAILGSAGFGKSTALQTFVLNMARMNSPEQIHFYLFDFGTNGLLPLKNLPHAADIVTLQEEEKLVKFIKRIRQEIQTRKDLLSEHGVASLAQYEAKSGKSLPVISIILDSFDSIQESSLKDPIESLVAQVLREGASLGIYISMTALRANSFRLAINSNLPTRMALFLVEDNGVREVVGREALIAQEIIGRGQIKTEEGVHEFQIYLPSAGANDIERLTAMEEEIKSMSEAWDGKVPSAIPMLPNVIYLSDFYKKKEVQESLEQLNLPLALDKESTKVVAFEPKKQGYFLIAEDTSQQSECLTHTILEGFKYLEDKVTRVVLNAGGKFTNSQENIDVLVEESEYATFLTELSTEIDERQANGWQQPTFIYIPDAHLLNNHILTSIELFKKMISQGPRNGIYIIFQGIQRSIESGFDEFNKRLRTNIPAGIFGTRVTDQNLVNVKIRIGEPIVPLDEAYYFEVRDIKHIKLNQ